jgi:oligopeptide/dipeptide ABC transporter ATP-binding protein
MSDSKLLEMDDVKTHFPVRKGLVFTRVAGMVKAVDGVSLAIEEGEILGLVGESGCGKSTLARSILQLIPPTSGSVRYRGEEITTASKDRLTEIRREMQMVFQDPYASLNPRMTVFDAIAEPLLVHGIAKRKDLASEVGQLMEKVGLAPRFMRKYPHEFSGGQRQRIAVARALAVRPKVIVADEPVSALDVSVQAQILNLLARLREEENLTLILISHDLSVVKYLSHRIAVMYLGKVVELGAAEQVFEDPQHPYTRALVSAIPVPEPLREKARQRMLLRGDPPSPMNPPAGCPFHPRCPYAKPECADIVPPLEERSDGRRAACIRLDEIPRFGQETAAKAS